MKYKKTDDLLIRCMDKKTGEKGYITLTEIGVKIFEVIKEMSSENAPKEKQE